MANSKVAGFPVIDTRDLRGLAKAFRIAMPAVAADLRLGLKAAGEIVAVEARRRSAWSSRIPGSITVRVSGASVSVVAGGRAAPDAAAYENKGRQGPFRHPVFGHLDRWVTQQARPFLAPAADAKQVEVVGAVAAAVDRALSESGVIDG